MDPHFSIYGLFLLPDFSIRISLVLKIKKHTLYMTQLCYINQDLEGAKTVDELVDELLKYLTTDSVMFRTPYTTDESLDGSPGVKLKNMQDEQWGPIQVRNKTIT